MEDEGEHAGQRASTLSRDSVSALSQSLQGTNDTPKCQKSILRSELHYPVTCDGG
jgi:hypothetical protein